MKIVFLVVFVGCLCLRVVGQAGTEQTAQSKVDEDRSTQHIIDSLKKVIADVEAICGDV